MVRINIKSVNFFQDETKPGLSREGNIVQTALVPRDESRGHSYLIPSESSKLNNDQLPITTL